MLNNASKYGIRAVLFLAKNANENTKYSAKNIASELEVPAHFIAKLLQTLVRKNIISSSKGPNGGFYFTEENGQHSICDVIEVIDGRALFSGCFMGLPSCDENKPCPAHDKVVKFKNEILKDFKDKNIIEFSKDIEANGQFIMH